MTLKTAITLTLVGTLFAWGCDADTKNVNSCGDGFIDPGEECDGQSLSAENCEQLGFYNQQGSLTCKSDCMLDTSVCASRCGDAIIQSNFGEECDGDNVAELACRDLGKGRGELTCKASCRFDTSACEFSSQCGDDIITEPYEQCEEGDLNGQSCESMGFLGGELGCADDCTFDTSTCLRPDACGDGVRGATETCDGTDLGGATCRSLGFWTGDLACASDCTFDDGNCQYFVDLSVGGNNVCALDQAGNGWCWGNGYDGQLGNGAQTVTNVPLPVTMPTNVTFNSISVGTTVVSALTSIGRAWQWGVIGTDWSTVPVPVQMPNQTSFLLIASGFYSSCGIDVEMEIWCWGGNTSGQLGNGTLENSPNPTLVSNPENVSFFEVTEGYQHRCALDNQGRAWCWGENSSGQLGNGSTEPQLVPTLASMPDGMTFVSLSSSSSDTVCALDQIGAAWCWGRPPLGNGTEEGSTVPARVTMPDQVVFVELAAGADGSCALDDTGLAWCWGEYPGNGSQRSLSPVPVQMPIGQVFTKISTNGYVRCGLNDLGMIFCWGDNYDGNLGNCNNINSSTPVPICEPM